MQADRTVLVTGCAGFAGSHFVQHVLENTNWKVIGIDSFSHRGDSLRVEELRYDSNRYEVHYADLNAPISNRLKWHIGWPDYIVNFASESHVDRSIEDPVPFVQNNVNLMLNMLELAREVTPQIFIQISTDEVYGACPTGSFKEWSTILPSNPYSGSKAAQEAICIAYWRTYGVPLVITNCMNMFGERQDTEKFVPMLIKNVAQGKMVDIHIDQNGVPGSRSYLHARNHADALLFILKQVGINTYGKTGRAFPTRFNIAGDKEVDNLEMATLVSRMVGKPLHHRLDSFHATRPGHDPRYALDDGFLRLHGWKPPVDFQKSLERTVKWTLERKEWMI